MKEKLNLDKLTKKDMKHTRAGAIIKCACACYPIFEPPFGTDMDNVCGGSDF